MTGSARLGAALGYRNIVSTDMGGTTFDVGLVIDGEPLIQTQNVIGHHTVGMPSIGISAIGAGGGSIAKVRHGYLAVGPESAGASPGPACYARGGENPTVTDADVVLGIIDPARFLGGSLELDPAAAVAAIELKVAGPLGLSVHAAAAAIKTVADNKMADLIRRVTIERGHDPRDFVIFAYGGGGPTHASWYAHEVGVQAIIVPRAASVLSALGISTADLRVTFERSEPMLSPPGAERVSEHFSVERLNGALSELYGQSRSALIDQGAAHEQIQVSFSADMRLRGQINELTVGLPAGQLSVEQVDGLLDMFVAEYEGHFGKGSAYPGAGVELMTLRVAASAPTTASALIGGEVASFYEATPTTRREVFLPEFGAEQLPVYDGDDLKPGAQMSGGRSSSSPARRWSSGPDSGPVWMSPAAWSSLRRDSSRRGERRDRPPGQDVAQRSDNNQIVGCGL